MPPKKRIVTNNNKKRSRVENEVDTKIKGRKGFATRRRKEDIARVSEVVLVDPPVAVEVDKKVGNNFYWFKITFQSPPFTIELREESNDESYNTWVREVIGYALKHYHAEIDAFTLVKKILVRNHLLFGNVITEDGLTNEIDGASLQQIEDIGKENWLLFATLCGCGKILKKSYIISSANENVGVSDHGFGFDILTRVEAMGVTCPGVSFWQKLIMLFNFLMWHLRIESNDSKASESLVEEAPPSESLVEEASSSESLGGIELVPFDPIQVDYVECLCAHFDQEEYHKCTYMWEMRCEGQNPMETMNMITWTVEEDPNILPEDVEPYPDVKDLVKSLDVRSGKFNNKYEFANGVLTADRDIMAGEVIGFVRGEAFVYRNEDLSENDWIQNEGTKPPPILEDTCVWVEIDAFYAIIYGHARYLRHSTNTCYGANVEFKIAVDKQRLRPYLILVATRSITKGDVLYTNWKTVRPSFGYSCSFITPYYPHEKCHMCFT